MIIRIPFSKYYLRVELTRSKPRKPKAPPAEDKLCTA